MDHKFIYEIADDYQSLNSLNIFCNAEDIDSITKHKNQRTVALT